METISVVTSSRPVLLVAAGSGSTLIYNTDVNNTVYLGDSIGMNITNNSSVAPLPPQSSLVVNGMSDVYAQPAINGITVQVAVIPGGVNFFQPPSRLVVAGPNEGIFSYSPVRGLNNLVATTGANQSGTDQYGNAYVGGDTVYHKISSSQWSAVSINNGEIDFLSAPNARGPWSINTFIVPGYLNFLSQQGPFISLNGSIGIFNPNPLVTGAVQFWLVPSGDQTGVIDTANIVFLLANYSQVTIQFTPGNFYIISGNINQTIQQHIFGAGRGATYIRVIDNAAAGFKPGFNIQESAGGYSIFYNSGIHHLLIDGTGTVRSNAIMFGDIAGIELEKLSINNFPSGTALYGNNRHHWTEQLKGEAWIQNCFNAMALDANGGTNSYDRMYFTMWVGLGDTQSAVRLIGGTGLPGDAGIQVAEGMLRIFGNFQNGNTGGGAVFTFDPTVTKSRNLLAMQIDVGVEIQGSGTTNPRTINFHNAAGVDYFARCYGTMFYFNNFIASNNNGNFGYDGIVFGDIALTTKMYLPDVLTVSATAPLNGSVFFEKVAANGKVFVKFAFSIPAGQTLAANQTICTAVGDPFFLHSDNTIITLWANGGGLNQGTSVIISSTGTVQNNGPVLSPVGSACFVYGQATYSNSY